MSRRGTTLVELVASCVLLGALLTVCLWLVQASVSERRATQERLVALQEAQNVLEDLYGRPWNDLGPDVAGRAQLSEQAKRVLPDGRVEAQIDGPQEGRKDVAAKRIAVSVRWRPSAARPELSVRLVAWKYAQHPPPTTNN
jgi:type II secretory pathway pseudopilin PulG